MINKELYVVKELLMLIDKYNHLIKTDGWYNEDVNKFYKLKDEVMEFLYVNKPKGIEIKLKSFTTIILLLTITECSIF